jgi:PhnB protein
MTHHVKPVPEGYHTVTAVLTVDDGKGALEFYTKALGAKETMRSLGPDGKISHAEFKVGDSLIMLSDESPQMGNRSPKTLGGTVGGLWLYVPDTDAMFQQAIAAGATSIMEPVDMFWGDRTSRIRDPFGHEWSISTHKEDVPPAELEKRAKEFYARMASRSPPRP